MLEYIHEHTILHAALIVLTSDVEFNEEIQVGEKDHRCHDKSHHYLLK